MLLTNFIFHFILLLSKSHNRYNRLILTCITFQTSKILLNFFFYFYSISLNNHHFNKTQRGIQDFKLRPTFRIEAYFWKNAKNLYVL